MRPRTRLVIAAAFLAGIFAGHIAPTFAAPTDIEIGRQVRALESMARSLDKIERNTR